LVGSLPAKFIRSGSRKREISQETQLKNTKAGKARRVLWGVYELRFHKGDKDPKAEVERFEMQAADLSTGNELPV
jgi:hypothetical protein